MCTIPFNLQNFVVKSFSIELSFTFEIPKVKILNLLANRELSFLRVLCLSLMRYLKILCFYKITVYNIL